jgi:hypothetical protein
MQLLAAIVMVIILLKFSVLTKQGALTKAGCFRGMS